MSLEKLYSLIRKKLGIESYVKSRTRIAKKKLKEEILSELKEQINKDFALFSYQVKEMISHKVKDTMFEDEITYDDTVKKLWELYRTLEFLEEQLNRLGKL